MAVQTMVVVPAVKAGILDIAAHGSALEGNASSGSDWQLPNDGKTVLMIVAGAAAGDTFTFTAVQNRFGRTETLAPVVAAGKSAIIGPFEPELWNNEAGQIIMVPTVGKATDTLLWVKVADPS